MTTIPADGTGRRRRLSLKGWLLIVALAVAGLVAVLVGIAVLVAPADSCSCSPVRPSVTVS